MIFAVLKFQFASNRYVLNFIPLIIDSSVMLSAHYANKAKTFLKHFSDCLFYFCSRCADSITDVLLPSIMLSVRSATPSDGPGTGTGPVRSGPMTNIHRATHGYSRRIIQPSNVQYSDQASSWLASITISSSSSNIIILTYLCTHQSCLRTSVLSTCAYNPPLSVIESLPRVGRVL